MLLGTQLCVTCKESGRALIILSGPPESQVKHSEATAGAEITLHQQEYEYEAIRLREWKSLIHFRRWHRQFLVTHP